MPNPQGSIRRALEQVTVGAAVSLRKREARDREMGFAEVEQQYQVKISGVGQQTIGFAAATITFDYPMHYAPGQRDSDLDRPQFWYGAESVEQIGVTAAVASWTLDPDNGAVIGAIVSVGVFCATNDLDYTGVVHLTFQGFGALSEAEPDVGG